MREIDQAYAFMNRLVLRLRIAEVAWQQPAVSFDKRSAVNFVQTVEGGLPDHGSKNIAPTNGVDNNDICYHVWTLLSQCDRVSPITSLMEVA